MSKRHSDPISTAKSLTLVLALTACGGADAPESQASGPWGDDITVISPDGTELDYAAPKGDGCISGEGPECITATPECGAGVPADVIIDNEGKVIDVVCYPTEGVLTAEQIESQQGIVAQNQNGAVLVLGDVADGVDFTGNLDVDANRFVIYGSGPDVSVVSGDLNVEGNNSIVRGIRVQGDLNIMLNDSALVFCVVEGDVHITGNNTHLSGCDIFGSVQIEGNNNVLNGNRIHGNLENRGKNTECANNTAFSDSNQDGIINPAELESTLDCTAN